MSNTVIESLLSKFPEAIVHAYSHRGDDCIVVAREGLLEVARHLREEPSLHFDLLVDVTAVDHLESFEEYRFEVVYQLYSLPHKHRLRIKVRLDEDDVHVPSLAAIWKSANWAERETYDMFGIQFDDHPDLRRILLYPEFEGHPLRKDYHFAQIQPRVELKDIGVPMSLGTPCRHHARAWNRRR